jgi:soluble lytic murein transglycosylase-like protein
LRLSTLLWLAPLLPLVVSGCTSMGGVSFAHATTAEVKAHKAAKSDAPELATAAIDMAAPDSPVMAYAAPVSPSSGLDPLIVHYSQAYGVPESLVRRVIVRESRYNPGARNGPYWGLMQIRHDTARSMGYSGPASGLLDAETNLRYAVKYLRGAWLCADGNEDRAIRLYASGYYYVAKHKGLLREVGLRS